MSAPPLPFVYQGGGVFQVAPRAAAACAEHYGQGECVMLAPVEEHSERSRGHQFAYISDVWKTLPEHLQDDFPTANHLRKWALIKAGIYDEQRIDVGTNAGAIRTAQAIRSFPGEAFSAVVVRGPLVVVRRAKSQAKAAMDPKEFQAAKQRVLEIISELIGVTPETLQRQRAVA